MLLGITGSSPEDQKTWAGEVGLTCDLLSDAGLRVARAYGAADDPDQERPKRVSVLVGPDGKVVKAEAISDAEAHPAEFLKGL